MRRLQHWLHSKSRGGHGAVVIFELASLSSVAAPSAPGWTLPFYGTSVPAYCWLGRYMQRAGSLGALDGAATALAHQLPRAVDSASSLTTVPATAVG